VWGVGFLPLFSKPYLIFREKVPKFRPDSSNGWHFFISKKPKDIIQQGF
jgi:hypothetical protein